MRLTSLEGEFQRGPGDICSMASVAGGSFFSHAQKLSLDPSSYPISDLIRFFYLF